MQMVNRDDLTDIVSGSLASVKQKTLEEKTWRGDAKHDIVIEMELA